LHLPGKTFIAIQFLSNDFLKRHKIEIKENRFTYLFFQEIEGKKEITEYI
jgi:hypothetical protein